MEHLAAPDLERGVLNTHEAFELVTHPGLTEAPHPDALIAASALGSKIFHTYLQSIKASAPMPDKHLFRPQVHIGMEAVIGCADA